MKSFISSVTTTQSKKAVQLLCIVLLTVSSLYPLAYAQVASAREAIPVAEPSQSAMEMVYVSQALFDVIAEWSESDASLPNGRGSVSLVDFVQSERPELAAEASEVVQSESVSMAKRAIPGEEVVEVVPPKGEGVVPVPVCSCRIIVPMANDNELPFINSPSTYETNTEHYYQKMRKWPFQNHVKVEESFYTGAYGAFHLGEGYRYQYHGKNSYTGGGITNSTELQFQMTCTNPVGDACEACTGELELRAQYESVAKTRSDSSGSPASNGSRAGAGDGVMLTYDPPGAEGEMVLMNKGVGSSHVKRATYDPESFLNLIKNAVQIGQAVVTGGTVEDDLLDDTVSNLLGLIERDGSQGTNSVNMRVVYDTADSSPIQINPNDVYRFAMTSVGDVDMSGFGPYSKSWSDYGSSGLIVYTANNFTCSLGGIPPQAQGAWFYADVEGPNSDTTLRNNVAAKISAELGIPVTVSNNMGVVNP